MLDLVRNPEDGFYQDAVHNNMVFQKKGTSNNSLVSITYTSFIYCRELPPGTVSLTGDGVRGDDDKQTSYYNHTVTKQTHTVTGPSYPVSDQAGQRLRWARKQYCQLCHHNYIIIHLSPGI